LNKAPQYGGDAGALLMLDRREGPARAAPRAGQSSGLAAGEYLWAVTVISEICFPCRRKFRRFNFLARLRRVLLLAPPGTGIAGRLGGAAGVKFLERRFCVAVSRKIPFLRRDMAPLRSPSIWPLRGLTSMACGLTEAPVLRKRIFTMPWLRGKRKPVVNADSVLHVKIG